jgi:hypothetical protein
MGPRDACGGRVGGMLSLLGYCTVVSTDTGQNQHCGRRPACLTRRGYRYLVPGCVAPPMPPTEAREESARPPRLQPYQYAPAAAAGALPPLAADTFLGQQLQTTCEARLTAMQPVVGQARAEVSVSGAAHLDEMRRVYKARLAAMHPAVEPARAEVSHANVAANTTRASHFMPASQEVLH